MERRLATVVTDGLFSRVEVPFMSIEELIAAITEPLGLAFVIQSGYVWISTPELIQAEVRRAPQDSGAIMPWPHSSRLTVSFWDAHLDEILNFLRDEYDLNIFVDHRVVAPESLGEPDGYSANRSQEESISNYVTDGMVPYLSAHELQIRHLLTAMLRELNLAYTVEDGFVWITSARSAKTDRFLPPATGTAEPVVVAALYLPWEIDIKDQPLWNVLEAAQKQLGITIAVDTREIDAAAPVVRHMKSKNLPAHLVLSVLTRKCGMAYVAEGDRVYVSTPAQLLNRAFPEEVFAAVTTSSK